ncbi:MAG: hypothetical protein AB1817_19045 [Chloroflexota bacterium]
MNADRNIQRLAAPASQLNLREDSADLRDLAARLGRALKPVVPTPEFRARLRDGLRMAAYHREMRELLVRERTGAPWGLLVGAAALGSAAGLLAILLRARQGARPAEPVVARE